jgi:hypothetical protein
MERLESHDGPYLRGLITDGDLVLAEVEFPGICRFHAQHRGRHRTFLELMVAFMGECAELDR